MKKTLMSRFREKRLDIIVIGVFLIAVVLLVISLHDRFEQRTAHELCNSEGLVLANSFDAVVESEGWLIWRTATLVHCVELGGFVVNVSFS